MLNPEERDLVISLLDCYLEGAEELEDALIADNSTDSPETLLGSIANHRHEVKLAQSIRVRIA